MCDKCAAERRVTMNQQKHCYLAIDIGASSGRHLIGYRSGDALVTDEVYRFPNGVLEQDGHLIWDTEALFSHVVAGIAKAFEKYPEIQSVSIDTWGVDYVLLSGDKEIFPCYAYRDGRTKEAIKRVHQIVPFEQLYDKTGIQFETFNTVYQLYDDLARGRLADATDFLMIPEYLTYRLTGVKYHEYTDATTTGLISVKTGTYDGSILEALGLPEQLFGALTPPGTKIGTLLPEIARSVGGQTTLIACASHDTASAVEGIPIAGDNPYISSGTWSLLGLRVPHPLTDADSRRANYSNEGGVGYTRYQKNIMGMWLINRLRTELTPELPFGELVTLARSSDFAGVVDVNDERFMAPESMVAAFDSAFTQENRPKTPADYYKCALVSLAHGYRIALRDLSKNTGKVFERLYIVGGGAKNTYLNELTAQICDIQVVALPIEATAIGNLKMQEDADYA